MIMIIMLNPSKSPFLVVVKSCSINPNQLPSLCFWDFFCGKSWSPHFWSTKARRWGHHQGLGQGSRAQRQEGTGSLGRGGDGSNDGHIIAKLGKWMGKWMEKWMEIWMEIWMETWMDMEIIWNHDHNLCHAAEPNFCLVVLFLCFSTISLVWKQLSNFGFSMS